MLRSFFLMFVIIVSLFAVANQFGSKVTGKPLRTDWPATTIAARFDSLWEKQTGCPLTIVAGENWLAIDHRRWGELAGRIDFSKRTAPPVCLDKW